MEGLEATPQRAVAATECEAAVKTTHKTRGVVVLDGLGVAEGLQDRVGLQELGLQFSLCARVPRLGHQLLTGLANQLLLLAVVMVGRPCNHGQVLDHLLGVLGFPCTRFSTGWEREGEREGEEGERERRREGRLYPAFQMPMFWSVYSIGWVLPRMD